MSYKLRYKEDDAIEVGLDEAGRGCLFGRLYVGAVVFSNEYEDFFDHGAALQSIKDSKVLTKRKRDILYDYIHECALDKSIAFAEASEVDEFNVLQADLRCMHRALDALSIPVERVLVDGDHWKPYKDTEGHAIVDGDAQYLAIAAAGILAKVARDRWMEEVVVANPEWNEKYGFSTNMGYGTAIHMKGLSEHGVLADHRRSYAPVRVVLGLPVKEKFQKGKKKSGWIGVDDTA